MPMHEYYFEQLEGRAEPDAEAPFVQAVADRHGGWCAFVAHLRDVASTRGIGWVVVYCDPRAQTLHTSWVTDHELGRFAGLPIILAIDMWEHAYMVDHLPKGKMRYVDVLLKNFDWRVVESRFTLAV